MSDYFYSLELVLLADLERRETITPDAYKWRAGLIAQIAEDNQ